MVKKSKTHKVKTSKKLNTATAKKMVKTAAKAVEHEVVEAAKTMAAVVKSKINEAVRPTTEKLEVHFVRKTLGKAPEEYHFVLHDGRKLKSLYELVDELETMSEDAFKEYATDFRNDFANWARDVFHAPDLAEELTRVRSKVESQKAIMKHMLRDVRDLVSPTLHKTHQAHKFEQSHKETGKHSMHTHNKGGKCVIR